VIVIGVGNEYRRDDSADLAIIADSVRAPVALASPWPCDRLR
jgi:hypothetical protein